MSRDFDNDDARSYGSGFGGRGRGRGGRGSGYRMKEDRFGSNSFVGGGNPYDEGGKGWARGNNTEYKGKHRQNMSMSFQASGNNNSFIMPSQDQRPKYKGPQDAPKVKVSESS